MTEKEFIIQFVRLYQKHSEKTQKRMLQIPYDITAARRELKAERDELRDLCQAHAIDYSDPNWYDKGLHIANILGGMIYEAIGDLATIVHCFGLFIQEEN